MKRKMFRIELKTGEWNFVNDIAIAAALANGGTPMNLLGLEAYANVKAKVMGFKDITVSLIGNCLLIDKGTENLLVITEVEIMELSTPEITPKEAKDLLDELTGMPTLDRQGGIANGSNHENLN